MELNEKLQQLRKQKGLTQEELAEMLYVSRTAVSKWESGRGYPSIDSLKALSKIYAVSIDDLLSSEELMSIAETDQKEKTKNMRDLIYGALDCMTAMMFFLPFFGQAENGLTHHSEQGVIRSVSMLELTYLAPYMRIIYFGTVILIVLLGILELLSKKIQNRIWEQNRMMISLGFSLFGVTIFMVSQQPYAGFFLLCTLAVKGILAIKR